MSRSYFALVAFLFIFHFSSKIVRCEDTCDASSIAGRELSGSIDSRRNDTGEWVTTFEAERTNKGNQSDINMVINHRYTECKGKTTIKIQGVIRELPFVSKLNTSQQVPEPKADFLRFHHRCGTNALVTNNGKSLQKIKIDKWNDGVAFTNRPLKDDEIFEVVVDARDDETKDAIGMGVTTHSPDTITIPSHMNSMKNGNWMMYLSNVYKDGSSLKSGFMNDLKHIKVGGKIGIKRTSSGDLHLFINGVDKGVAANGVPSPVYGVFELYNYVTKVTIIDH